MLKRAFGLVGLLALATYAEPALAQNTTLNVGVIKIGAFANAWFAQQEGMFKKRGLDVKIVEFRSGNEAVSALQGGSVDIVPSIPGIAMTAIERGFDLVVVTQNEIARSAAPDSGSVQVLKESTIQNLADLRGRKVGISSLYSQNAIGVKMLIEKAGVDLKSVQFIEMPATAQVEALRGRQIDAVSTVDPYTTQLQANGIGRVISWNYVESLPAQPLGAWYAKRTFQRSNEKAMAAFADAIHESIDVLSKDDVKGRAAVTGFTGLDPALVKEMQPPLWKYEIDLKKWQDVADMMRSAAVLEKPFALREHFMPSLLAQQGL